MKVTDLIGADLDLWVAKAEGVDAVLSDTYPNGMRSAVTFYDRDHDGILDGRGYVPSEHWSDGGPIIDKNDIVIERIVTAGDATLHYQARKYPHQMTGPTYLIAAMRALVAFKFGDEVGDA